MTTTAMMISAGDYVIVVVNGLSPNGGSLLAEVGAQRIVSSTRQLRNIARSLDTLPLGCHSDDA